MKCQQCEKPATFHITELTGDQPQEVHLCETCAKSYLTQGEPGAAPVAPTLASVLAKQLQLGKAAEELAKLDQRACPTCGITFYEFRNQGRLGCPHDYVFFEKELTPLIANIHGETQHVGKRPRGHEGGSRGRRMGLEHLLILYRIFPVGMPARLDRYGGMTNHPQSPQTHELPRRR